MQAPYSESEPRDPKYDTEFKAAYGILYFIAALNIILGIVAIIGVEFLTQMGISWFNIVFGVLFGVLAIAAHQTKSIIPVVVGIVFFGGEFLLGVALSVMAGQTPTMSGIFFRGVLLFTMAKPLISKFRG
jgi:hypothetical protein